jgi:LysM repeat protein
MKSAGIDLLLLRRTPIRVTSISTDVWLILGLIAFILIALCRCQSVGAAQDGWNSGRKAVTVSSSDELRYELRNCTTEIEQLRQRNENLTQRLEEVQQELSSLKESGGGNLQNRMDKIESSLQALTDDLKQIKSHSNQTATTLAQYRTSLADLEKSTSTQRDNVVNLESALHSLMDLYQTKSVGGSKAEIALADTAAITSTSKARYKVKAGDTLDKIARENKTTVSELKRCNQLKKDDLIIVGQELALP